MKLKSKYIAFFRNSYFITIVLKRKKYITREREREK